MSWFDSIIPPISRSKERKSAVPEGQWKQCVKCDEAIFSIELAKSLGVCKKCGHHHYLNPRLRAESLFDPGAEIEEVGTALRPRDFLKFVDIKSYKDRIKQYSGGDATREALSVFHANLGKRSCIIACFDFSFMGGSMGSVVGERFMRGVEQACDQKAPFIVLTSSGGARMQEGLVSLFQMAKTAAAQAKLAENKLPFISVLCNPTTGGVAASFAMVADVVIAEPGATIGFAGARVIKQTVREELPADFQSSEFLLEHGSIDMVVHRSKLRTCLVNITSMLMECYDNRPYE